MARIKQKIKQGQTKEITEPGKDEEERPRSAQVIDLAELLRKSLGKGGAAAKSTVHKAATTGAKPALRVLPISRGATKTAAKRKRA